MVADLDTRLTYEMSGFRKQEATSRYLQERILGWGASLVGFADLRGVVPPPFSRWPNAVSIALALDRGVMAGLQDGPTPEYYEEYKRVNCLLNEIAAKSADYIFSLGYDAEAFPATIVDKSRPDEFESTLSVAFQHKTAATRAALGWIGKSALLVTPQSGPRVRLTTVFTDMPLDVGIPVTAGRCGDCRACLLACPAGVIKGQEWKVGLMREKLVDAWACRAKAKQLLLERVGVEDSVCGVCVSVCPIGMNRNGAAS
jgi:epoxyqueuosine reductase